MTGSTPATPRVGRWLSAVGGALCVVGYVLPWAIYHPDIEGTIGNRPWNGWSGAWDGWHTTPPDIVDRLVGAAVLVGATLPLLLGLLALVVGAREWLGRMLWVPRALYWTVIVLATLALLLMTYSVDPLGWSADTDWVIFREPAPTIEIGLYMMYAGTFAILAGGLLSRERRADKIVAQHT
jgi:hypothetical protein